MLVLHHLQIPTSLLHLLLHVVLIRLYKLVLLLVLIGKLVKLGCKMMLTKLCQFGMVIAGKVLALVVPLLAKPRLSM